MSQPVVIAYGMGVDSTAMMIGWHARGETSPDAILFADTGSEKPETYAYLPVISAWLASVGFPPVTVLKRASPRAGDTSLFNECIRKSVLPSLAYGGHSCSLKWKVDPQWAWTKRHYGWTQPRRKRGQVDRPAGTFAHGPTIQKLIGYDSGPADRRRVTNAVGKWPPGHLYRYPLIEWGWNREKCIEVIAGAGLPVPMKSACFMCPASKKPEIAWLKENHPSLFSRVIDMERLAKAKGLRTVKGNGRNFDWEGCDL